LKAAINQWAFGDMSTLEAISLAKQVGFEAFEVCVDEKTCLRLDSSEAEATAVRRHADTVGIELCSLASGMGWGYPLTSPDKTVREKGKEIIAKSLQIGEWLGVGALLTVPGIVDAKTPYDAALENALMAIRDLVPVAEKHRVAIAVENVWNKFLLSPIEMRDFIDQFDSDCVGAYFDVGNVIAFGYPEQWIRILGKRIRSVHAKDFRASVGTLGGFVMLMEGDVNWPEVMGAFRDVGYDGAMVAEYFPNPGTTEITLEYCLSGLKKIKSL
jgi:L-ribulose-5-phosphate 3-epimerase